MDLKEEGVYFTPYIGEQFQNQETRVLLLGESHYDKDEGNEKTRLVVKRYLEGESYTV